jgi:hypothetical protein
VGAIFAIKNNYSEYFKDRKETINTYEIKNDTKALTENELEKLENMEEEENIGDT